MPRKEQTAPYDTSNDSTDHMGSEVSPGAATVYHQNVQKTGEIFCVFCCILTCFDYFEIKVMVRMDKRQ
jgi:hypothetical protein